MMLTCQQLTELVTDYLEGRLSFLERARFQMHLGMCRNCRTYLRQMKTTVRVLGKLPAEAMSTEMRDQLLAQVRGMRPRGGAAPTGPSPSIRILDALERVLGSGRGWAVIGAVLAVLLFSVFLSGAEPGLVGDGSLCVATELGAGLVPLVLLGLLAASNGSRLSSSVYAVAASSGALVGYVSLQLTCDMGHLAPHLLAFHVGGVLLAAAMGTAASRLPALR